MPALSNDITVTINKFRSTAEVEFCGARAPVGARTTRCKNKGARKKTQVSSGGNVMKAITASLLALAGLALGAQCALAQAAKSQVERLYVIDCGTSVGPDKSRWTPGVDVGKPLDMVGNCYLIRHAQGYMVWDTGVSDDVASMPNGRPGTDGSPHWRRSKTLAGEIEKLGLKPADIKYLAVSHTHPDHIGNVELFPQTMLLVQKAEYDWPSPSGPRFKPTHPVTKLEAITMCSATAA
jgi:N-acyl homoserine lactone hydrolase